MPRRFRRTLAVVAVLALLYFNAVAVLAAAAEEASDGVSSYNTSTTDWPTDENGKMPDGKPPNWNNKHVIYIMTGVFLALIFVYGAIVFTCAWLFMTKCPRMYT